MRIFGLTLWLGLDAVMVLFFLSSLAFRITGRAPHEWIGLFLCALFCIHTVINLDWYRKLFKGRYALGRLAKTLTNLALLTAMAVLCTSGILNSRHVFGFSQYVDGMIVRQVHSVTAYWGLVLIGIHIGLQWKKIMGVFCKATGASGESRIMVFMLRALALLIVTCGIWASFDRDMGSKLFLGFSFDFWEPDRPILLFYTGHLAIMAVYAFVAYHALRLTKSVKNRRPIQFFSGCRTTGKNKKGRTTHHP